jgi:hypothetical protein
VKFETTPGFDSDYRRLKPEHRETFRRVLSTKFIPACDALAATPSAPWPRSLRVKSAQGAPGVLEMTWSIASPDGRVTFDLVTVDGELRCRWRRVGDHGVFETPKYRHITCNRPPMSLTVLAWPNSHMRS